MARWEDPVAVLGRGYHLTVALRDRVAELESLTQRHEERWGDPAALKARLAELTLTPRGRPRPGSSAPPDS